MLEQDFKPGEDLVLGSDAPDQPYSVFFEDDGETAYFYALDLTRPDNSIVDAMHIYKVANVVDRDRPSTITILWSSDGLKCALLINEYPHAAFDFFAKRGYCRTNFPNIPTMSQGDWSSTDHSWSEEAVSWLR